MPAGQGLVERLVLDAKQFFTSWNQVKSEVKSGADSMKGQFSRLSKDLAQSFDAGKKAAGQTFDQAKQAAAQLVVEGKKGTAEWDKQVRQLKQAAADALKYDKALEQVGAELGEMGQKAKQTGGLMTGALNFAAVQTGVQAVADAAGAVQGPFLALDKQIKNIGTLGVENFQQFADLTLDLSKKVPDNAAKLAEATYNAISAGISGTNEEIIKFVETASKAAVAGVSDTNTSVNALTSVLNAYKLEASDVSTVADTMFATVKLGKTSFSEIAAGLANVVPAASAAKVEFKEVGAVIAQMTALGVPTAQATTQIRAALIEVQKPAKPLADVMANVGLSAANMGEQLQKHGLVATLQKIQGSAASMGLSLTQVFGSAEAASAALLVTGENAERANKLLAQVDAEIAGGAATGAFEVAAEGAEVQSQIIGNKIQAFFSGIFGKLGTEFNAFLGAMTNVAPVVSAFSGIAILGNNAFQLFSGLKAQGLTLPGVIAKVGASLKGAAASALSFGKAGLKSMFSMKGAALGAAAGIAAILFATEEGQEAMQEIGTALSEAVAPIISTVMPLITGIIDAIKPVLNAIVGVITTIVDSVSGALTGIIGGMAEAFGQLFGIIGPLLEQVLSVITPIITAVGGSLFAAFSNVADAVSEAMGTVSQIFSDVFATLGPIITQLSATLTPIFQQLGEVIGGVFSTIGMTIAGLVQNFVPIIQQLATNLAPVIQQLAETFGMIFNVIAGVFGDILSTVVPIIGELVGTVGALLGNLLNQILPLLLPIVQTIAEVFGTALSQIATILSDVFTAIAPVIQQLAATLTPIISQIAEVITGVLGTVLPIVANILQQILGVLAPVLETVGGLISTIANTIGTVLAQAFEALAPVLNQIVGVLGTVLSTIGEVIGNLLSSLQPVIEGLVGVIGQILGVIGNLVSTLLEALAPVITVIVDVLGQMLGIIGGLVNKIVTALQPVLLTLADLFGQIFSVVGEVLQQLAASLQPILLELAGTFGELVSAVGETVGELVKALVPILELVADLVGQLVAWLADKLQVALQALTPIITAVARMLAQGLAKGIELAVKLLNQLMRVLTPIIRAIGQWLTGAIRDVVEWIRGALASALNWLGGVLDWIRGAFHTVTGAIANVIGWIKGFVAQLRKASPIINFFGNILDKIIGFLGDLVGWIKDAVVEFLKFVGLMDDAPKKVSIDVEINQTGEIDLGDDAPESREIPIPEDTSGPSRTPTPEGDVNSDDPFQKRLGELGELKESEVTNAKDTIKNEEQLKIKLLEIDRTYARKRLVVAQEFADQSHEEAKESLNNFKEESIDAGKALNQARGDLLRQFSEKVAKEGEDFLERQKEFVDFVGEVAKDLVVEEKVAGEAIASIEDVRKRLAAADSPLLPEEEELKKALDKIPEALLSDKRLADSRAKLAKAVADADALQAERLERVEKEKEDGIISEAEAEEAKVLITRASAKEKAEALGDFYKDVEKLRAEDAQNELLAEQNKFSLRRKFLDLTRALVDAFYDYKDEARQGDLEKELDTLKKEEEELTLSLAKRATTFQEYDKRVGEIAERRAELEAELNAGAVPLDKRVKDALKKAADVFATQQTEQLRATVEEKAALEEEKETYIRTKVIELRKAGVEEEKALREAQAAAEEQFGAQIIASREKMYAQTVATAVASFAQLRKDGGNLMVDMGIAAIDALIPLVSGALSTALLQAFAFLGPIGGPLAAGAITAAAAVALSALRGAIAELDTQKAATGIVNIPGPGTDTSDNLHFMLSPGESVLTAKGTRAQGNKKLFGWINKTGRSWLDFARLELPNLENWTPPQPALSDIHVTPAGDAPDLLPLMRATQEQTERLERKFDEQYRLDRWRQAEDRAWRQKVEKRMEKGGGQQMDLFGVSIR